MRLTVRTFHFAKEGQGTRRLMPIHDQYTPCPQHKAGGGGRHRSTGGTIDVLWSRSVGGRNKGSRGCDNNVRGFGPFPSIAPVHRLPTPGPQGRSNEHISLVKFRDTGEGREGTNPRPFIRTLWSPDTTGSQKGCLPPCPLFSWLFLAVLAPFSGMAVGAVCSNLTRADDLGEWHVAEIGAYN